MLTASAFEGKLSTRADVSKHQGDFRKIIDGVKYTLDAVIGPLKVSADYVDKISKGDIPEKITQNYNGDFNLIKNNINTCIDAVNLLISDTDMLATRHLKEICQQELMFQNIREISARLWMVSIKRLMLL